MVSASFSCLWSVAIGLTANPAWRFIMPNRHAAAKSNSALSSVFPVTKGAPLRSCAIPKLYLVDLATPPYKNVVQGFSYSVLWYRELAYGRQLLHLSQKSPSQDQNKHPRSHSAIAIHIGPESSFVSFAGCYRPLRIPSQPIPSVATLTTHTGCLHN